MGVNSKNLTQDKLDGVLLVFDTFEIESMSLPSIFEPFWLELVKDGRFINDYKVLKKNIGKKVCCVAASINLLTYWDIQPEARARMLTDYVLTQLMVFVDKHLGLVQFMFLELLLSSSSYPVPITHRNTATLLTGSVDYAILSSTEARDALAKALGVEPDKVEDSGSWCIRIRSLGWFVLRDQRAD